ncbi:MAG0770 family lipoprotein [Mycoplasmopsis fermentans]|uniref:MAG0770 family lipoprotein n=1 Tax=Mycoplasmopsis fermentans TaxID=2115 RepID=UPI000F03E09D|nr:hypothetical protein [Mycoplasmopsis fermentans]RMX36162.1 hypothetical protein MFI2_0142 [Mycoplasmopsis fermentans MF-I2]
MSKRRKLKFLISFTVLTTTTPLTSAACQSSFWDMGEYEKNNFVSNLKQNVSIYTNNFNKLVKFMDKDNHKLSYQSFYYKEYEKTKEITDFTFENFLLKNSKAFEEKAYKFMVNNVDESTKFKKYFEDFTSTPSDNTNFNFYKNVTYLKKINDEINSILNDWSKYIKNDSTLSQFKNLFENSHWNGWPFFENQTSRQKWYQDRFLKWINQYNEEIESEYKNRYYDEDKASIDYSTIKNPSSESDGKHTHAAINLLREWKSTVISPKDRNNRINKLNEWINDFKKFITDNSWEYKAKNIMIVFNSNYKLQSVDLYTFVDRLEKLIKNSQLPYEKDKKGTEKAEEKYKNFKRNFLEPIDNMKQIINDTVLLINEYK